MNGGHKLAISSGKFIKLKPESWSLTYRLFDGSSAIEEAHLPKELAPRAFHLPRDNSARLSPETLRRAGTAARSATSVAGSNKSKWQPRPCQFNGPIRRSEKPRKKRVATRTNRSHGAYPYRGSGWSLGRVTLSRGPKQTCRMAIRELNVHRGWFTADSPHLVPPRGAASAHSLLVLSPHFVS